MLYFDSAYIAKFYLSEPDSGRVRTLAEREGKVCCSTIGRVETAQVFHRKLREGKVTKAACGALFDQFGTDCESGLWTWLPLTEDLVAAAVHRFRELSPKVLLRSADAIHLVSARAHGLATIYTNDVRVLAAASGFGIRGQTA
ncbi:MAG: type II toxin-antitoxin system VapC family toxin [Vicinamibacterales bacterium]